MRMTTKLCPTREKEREREREIIDRRRIKSKTCHSLIITSIITWMNIFLIDCL